MPSPNSETSLSYTYRGKQFPTLGFIVQVHDEIVKSGGCLPGWHDRSILESAVHAPVLPAGGEDAHYRFFDKVAILTYRIAAGHAFHDGNKRTAMIVAEAVLNWNRYYLT